MIRVGLNAGLTRATGAAWEELEQPQDPQRLSPAWFSCPTGGPAASPAGLGAEAEAGLYRSLSPDQP